jgi:hypothetical protein
MSYARQRCPFRTCCFRIQTRKEGPKFGHVKRLKDLALVARTITVESKHSGGPLKVFHSKSNAGAEKLGADNTIAPEEMGREDMHRAALSIGHAHLAAEQLTDDTGDCATTEDRKRVAAVGRDNLVLLGYSGLQTN